ncbi:hypothetical protein Nepgr_024059 [Nepenthes gracilis]|uniref:PRONE domain-containing protein n=1 Tax=Nepenthes gracilis TaxID=150966 RepID=A0AAD3Y039_NEPGR|nr:hypothetical protein Nepgr_024059 [Nepenthes gracilis]
MGHAVLEIHSRTLGSLVHTVLSRIEDVLYADSFANNPSLAECEWKTVQNLQSMKFPYAWEETEKLNTADMPTSMTLSDFMGWNLGRGRTEDCGQKPTGKPQINIPPKKVSHVEKLDNVRGLRSPTQIVT